MAHFMVGVITKEKPNDDIINSAMEPFEESYDLDNRFVDSIDIHDNYYSLFLDSEYNNFEEYLKDVHLININDSCEKIINNRLCLIKNPYGIFDNFHIGRCFDNVLINKNKEYGNSFKISDLDIDCQQKEIIKELVDSYNNFYNMIPNINIKHLNRSEIRELIVKNNNNINKSDTYDMFHFNLNCYKKSLEDYLNSFITFPFLPYYLVIDNEYNSDNKGLYKMKNYKENNEWQDIFKNILEKYNDHFLTIVDCHS